jgi:hypothetical protein
MGVTLLESGVVDGGDDGGVVGGVVDGEAGVGKKGFSKSSAGVVRHLIPKRLPSAVRQRGTRVFGNMLYSFITSKLFIDRKDSRE